MYVHTYICICISSLLRTGDPGVNRQSKKSSDGRTLVSVKCTAINVMSSYIKATICHTENLKFEDILLVSPV